MTTAPADANAELVRTSVELLGAGDLDACVARLAPDFVMHLAGVDEPLRGPEAWREGAALMKRAFPDLRIDVEDIVAAGDRVAARLTLHATHTGEYLGFPPSGRAIRYASHELYRIAGGLFAEEWVCSDNATLFAQLSAA